MKFSVGEKVILNSKSTGRDFHKSMYDVRHKIQIDGVHCPVGWITEIRNAYPAYFVIAYTKNGLGTDYYWAGDLAKIDRHFFLEDGLFEI